jgi:methylmalonyl-CoA mutase N-terminal domain/subunit
LEAEQRQRLAEVRAGRDDAKVSATLDAIRGAAPSYLGAGQDSTIPLMPLIIGAVRARASLGEISDALRATWGEYRPV